MTFLSVKNVSVHYFEKNCTLLSPNCCPLVTGRVRCGGKPLSHAGSVRRPGRAASDSAGTFQSCYRRQPRLNTCPPLILAQCLQITWHQDRRQQKHIDSRIIFKFQLFSTDRETIFGLTIVITV